MSSTDQPVPSDTPGGKPPSPDDTAAFQAYYRAPVEPAHGLLYRVFIGWWRNKT